MFNVVIRYLSETTSDGGSRRRPGRLGRRLRVLSGPDILQFQELSRQVVIAEEIARLHRAAR